MAKTPKLISLSAPVAITAGEVEGEKKGPAKFTSTFYTGGAMNIEGWDLPVVIDLAGLKPGRVLVANLDHDPTKRVGNFEVVNDGESLVAVGKASAATAARDEVVDSAKDGYVWQSSLEVSPQKVETLKQGKSAVVNGQTVEGPAYITRVGILKGFAFVSHGADDNTTVAIAASAASNKEKTMKADAKKWAEDVLLIDVDTLSDEQKAAIEANYEGQHPAKPKGKGLKAGIEAQQAEADRIGEITDYALKACEKRQYDVNAREVINAINDLAESAIEQKWSLDKFRLELIESGYPMAHAPRGRRENQLTSRVVEAAICVAGRLEGHEKMYDDQTLQLAHDRFKNGIGLKQLFLLAAESNGYRANYAQDVGIEVQRAAFGMQGPQQMIRAQGWSTIEISSILSNVANKFLRDGWDAVDMTPLKIASVRNVRDFKQITTVSLTGDLQFEKVGAAGEIKHGELGELVYTNKADTYAKMLAITRQDIINDDLGALTAVPRRLGRGSALKLNDLFWTVFLAAESNSFISSGNGNFNEGVADMTSGGLAASEVLFMNQTDPDSKPLGLMPAILLVPTALKAAALALMTSEKIKGDADGPDGNVWRGRFRVESSPYMHNSAYTGYSSSEWYMLANPSDMPFIEIAALNGRVEPIVETADADFNVLGVQMRGYSDVGVAIQEYRAIVKNDGGSS